MSCNFSPAVKIGRILSPQQQAVVSKLVENALIGLSWAVLDYDENNNSYEGFWNLSHKTRMDSDASNLCAFRLMPLEAQWEFQVVDMDRS